MKSRDNRAPVESRLRVGMPLPSFSNQSTHAQEDAPPTQTTVTLPLRAEPANSSAQVALSREVPATPASAVQGTLTQIPVHLIDPNPLAPREVYTPEMISARAEDLRDQGQHDPIHVIPNPNAPGRYIICDGWTRVQACITHKVLEALWAQVHDLPLTESAWFGYEQNEGRAQHTDFDRAMFYEKMLAEGITPTELSGRVKIQLSSLTMYRAYAKLPAEILQLVRENPTKFGSRVAYALLRMADTSGSRRSLALAAKFAAEDQSVRWLLAQVPAATASAPKTRKTAEPLKHLRFANGFYKQRAEEVELKIAVPKEKLEEFAQALEALLETVAVAAPSSDAAGADQVGSPGTDLLADESDV